MFKIFLVTVLVSLFHCCTTLEDFKEIGDDSTEVEEEMTAANDINTSDKINEIINMFYKTYKYAIPLAENHIRQNKNAEVLKGLDEFNSQLNDIAAEAMNKLSYIIEFGNDAMLINAINKPDEDDMDGVIDEE